MVKAQTWLKDNYEKQQKELKVINNKGIELDGELRIDNYPQLEKIFLGSDANKITELIITGCPNVETIFVSNNQLTKIDGLAGLTKLQKLSFGDNKIEEIDISQNKQLKMLYFARNPKNLKFVNGVKGLSELVFWNSDDTFAITTLLEQVSEADLKEIAEKLGLNVDGETSEEIKQIIKDEADKIEQNKTKLSEKFPGLLDKTAKVDDKKLEEIKNNVDKGEEYQKLMTEPTNAPIVETETGKIGQTKLTDELKKAAGYESLVTNPTNNDLVTEDGKEIDQKKIDGLRTASGNVAAAISILGVDDLKPDTLNAKLGGSKLSDIQTNLKELLGKNKNLEDALRNAGINPDGTDLAREIAMLMGLQKRVEELYGKKYVEELEVQEYQNQVEINTNN
jgi:hypothetical protein